MEHKPPMVDNQQAAPRVGLASLGCPKALVDSELIVTQLRAEGYEIGANYQDSDIVIVNTCGFINSAIDESLETIGEALNENGKVIVTGCLGANAGTITAEYPNVLAVTGPHALQEVMTAVHAHLPPSQDPYTSLIPPQGIKLTPRHYAYLKISEGCNHRCSFCIIPQLRGDLDSRPIGDVLQEAANLVDSGVSELLVISQDTSAYGVDVKYRTGFWNGRPVRASFAELCRELSQMDAWVRLHYVYPYPHVDEVIPLMNEGGLLPYLDIPFQHASPSILKAMKRPAHTENILKRLQQWRQVCPELVIRSTFIVGFPGETEDDFEQLLEFLHKAQLDRVGAFTYSAVEGAAANNLPNPVAEEIKQERLERFMNIQAEISASKLQRRIGTHMTVLVDDIEDDAIIARTYADAPEIDGQVIINHSVNSDNSGRSIEIGDFIEVEINNADDHDLHANWID